MRPYLVSWSIARGARAGHVAEGLGVPRTRCGLEIPTTRPSPRVLLSQTWSPLPPTRPTDMCASCWPIGTALEAEISSHPIEDEPLTEAVRNALQRLELLPTAETIEQADAILTDVKRRLTQALQRESLHA